jgi:hypothetical protein
VGDGDEKDRNNVCERPVQVTPDLRIAQCMELIEPRDVIRAIEFYGGDRLQHPEGIRGNGAGKTEGGREGATEGNHDSLLVTHQSPVSVTCALSPPTSVLIDFRHGLGDAVQLITVLLHLRHYHPDWQIDVAVGVGKLPEVADGLPSPSRQEKLDGLGRPGLLT